MMKQHVYDTTRLPVGRRVSGRRTVCILLAALLLLGTVSCADTEPHTETATETAATMNTSPEATDTAAEESETLDPGYVCELPELDFGDAHVGILYSDKPEFIGEAGGGLVSSAVHERNVQVEEELGIAFDFHYQDALQIQPTMQSDILSGDGAYDIVANCTYLIMQPALEGMYVNLSELAYIDTSKSYWSQSYNEMMTYTDADIQFHVSGPIALSMYRYPFVTVYNKQLFADYHIPDLYDTVNAGAWTLDYQYSIIQGHYLDKDGNGVPSYGDMYGLVTENIINVDPYSDCADVRLIVKDPETKQLVWNDAALSTLVELCDKVQKIYNDEATLIYPWGLGEVTYDDIIEHFTEGRALMATVMFREVEKYCGALANMSYGIAPMPKFKETQVGYRTRVQDSVTGFGISAVVTDEERRDMLAAVLESMAYHSNHLTYPAYYEHTLSERFMQDPQSVEMLDLIFASVRFDFGMAWSGEFRDRLRPLLSGTSNTIASETRTWKRKAERMLEEYNVEMEELKNKLVGN